ncbi:MAG: phage holin [Clostridia bacterium]|jgi:phi LC3 family holin|nr:phage holin [Clostridia bacterium]
MINWKVRLKNPMFWAQLVLSVIMPILAYLGLTAEDLNSWARLGEVLLQAVSSPYILGLVIVSVYNAITDPTTSGFTDSKRALTYTKPNSDKD